MNEHKTKRMEKKEDTVIILSPEYWEEFRRGLKGLSVGDKGLQIVCDVCGGLFTCADKCKCRLEFRGRSSTT
jgi:hypothetical protein